MDLESAEASVKVSLYAYVDAIQLWTKHPLSPKELRWLNGQVGDPLHDWPFNFLNGRGQRLILTQASEECLRFFAERDDVTLSYVETALDIISPAAQQLLQACSNGFAQRWHGERQWRVFDGDNFRTADRGHGGISFQGYSDKHSKTTGEVDCFHVEAWIKGMRALRQVGINSVADLLVFDHAKFWQRHFVIIEIDFEKLGRFDANRRAGTATRRRSTREADAAAGEEIWRRYGALPVQKFLKAYAKATGTPSYVMRCRNTFTVTSTLLHKLNILPEPDLSLLTPELAYPLTRKQGSSLGLQPSPSLSEEARP